MSNKEKINYLLAEVKRLENLLVGVQDAEVYPVSFFDQSFELTRELLKELYQLEAEQVETLCKQMEARQEVLQEILVKPLVQIPEKEENEPAIFQEQPEKSLSDAVDIEEEELVADPEPEVVLKEIVEEAIEETFITPEPVEAVTEEETFTDSELNSETIQEELPAKEEKSIEELLKEYATPQPLIPEKTVVSLSEVLEKKKLTDFRKAFSLNDRFYFLRELFHGDDAKMNEVITDLNEIESLEESLDYLNNKLRWNPEDTAVADFIQLLEKRFL